MLPQDKPVPIDKPESSNGDQKDKKLNEMSTFPIDFYSCDDGGVARVAARAKHQIEYLTDSQWAEIGEGEAAGGKVLAWRKKRADFDYDDDDDEKSVPINKPESSNGDQKDKNFNKLSSFAREFYSADILEAPRVARARQRMEYLTDSQWAVLGEELGAEIREGKAAGGGGMVDQVLAWRKKRGDFNSDDDDDDDKREDLLGDVEVPQLPMSDMEGVTESTLHLGFLKSDLQLECLLRNLRYEASDSKPQLISKLMHYKDTSFLHTNTFQILKDQCITSTSRDDERGTLNDGVESDTLNSEYLTDSQGAGQAAPSMVDAWRKKTGGFHYDDDEEEEEEDYADDDDEEEQEEDEVDDEQEVFICDEDDGDRSTSPLPNLQENISVELFSANNFHPTHESLEKPKE